MGRSPLGKAPVQQIQIIRGKHIEIIRRMIVGESQRKIAADLGMSEGRLSVIVNSPLFKRLYAEEAALVRERFIEKTSAVAEKVNSLQPKAIETLESLLTKDKVNEIRVSPALKREVALDILDLGGNGKRSKVDEKANAMNDVIKIISDGFALAKSAFEERIKEKERREEIISRGGVANGEVVINVPSEDLSTDNDEPVNLIPENIDGDNNSDNGNINTTSPVLEAEAV